MPDPMNEVAEAILATTKPTGRKQKLPALVAKFSPDTQRLLRGACMSDMENAHLTRTINALFEKYGIPDRVVERTVRDWRARVRGSE